jgi:hypothetical protein
MNSGHGIAVFISRSDVLIEQLNSSQLSPSLSIASRILETNLAEYTPVHAENTLVS